MTEPLPSIANERVGWILIFFAAIITGSSFGAMMTVTVFLEPLEASFGWLRQDTSLAYMIGNVAAGFGGILMGSWADRFSPRPVILTGAIILGGSFIGLGLMQTRLEFYLFYGMFLSGLGVSAFMVPIVSHMGFWFDRNRGLALSLMMGGQSLGAATVPYLASTLIDKFGWRDAYLLLGAGSWLLLIPLCFIVREPPGLARLKAATRAQAQAAQDEPAVSSRGVVSTLSLAAQGCCICMAMPLVHLVPLATGLGYSNQTAAGILSVLMLASMAGRPFFGKAMDWFGGTRVLFVSSGFQTLSVFWFTQVDSLPALYGLAILFGLGFGGVFPAYTVIIGEMISPHQSGRSTGLVFFSAFIGMGLGGYLGGFFYDLTGNYATSFGIAALAGVANLIVVALFYLRTKVRPPTPEPAPQPA